MYIEKRGLKEEIYIKHGRNLQILELDKDFLAKTPKVQSLQENK